MKFLMQKWVTERRITEEREVEATDVFEATRIASKDWGWPQNEMQFINSVPLTHGAANEIPTLAMHQVRRPERASQYRPPAREEREVDRRVAHSDPMFDGLPEDHTARDRRA